MMVQAQMSVSRNHPDYEYWTALKELPEDEKWESLIGVAGLITAYPQFTRDSLSQALAVFGDETEDDGHGWPVRCLLTALAGGRS